MTYTVSSGTLNPTQLNSFPLLVNKLDLDNYTLGIMPEFASLYVTSW